MKGTITMSPGQYVKKSAFHPLIGDPLLQKMVSVVEPDWRSRINGELMDTAAERKALRSRGITFIPGSHGDGQQIVFLNR